MPPKKDDKKKKAEDSPEERLRAELAALEGFRQDQELALALLADNLKQSRAENARLLGEVERFRTRIAGATRDYADILEHREDRVRGAEARCGELSSQLERLRGELSSCNDDIKKLKGDNSTLQSRVEDAASMLTDKDTLEQSVRRQHGVIEKLDRELKAARGQVEAKDEAIAKAEARIEELTLRCAATTRLVAMFGEPWLVATTHWRLKGDIPLDREFNTLTALAGGKQLVLIGGHARGRDDAGREVAVLSIDSLQWERPEGARCEAAVHSHTTTSIGRNRLLLLFGLRGDEASPSASVLSADSLRWIPLVTKGPRAPPARLGHAAAAMRERVWVFGGMTGAGALLGDLWSLDLDTAQWAQHTPLGAAPCPRKGATLCATEDGRRLYLFGGHDGTAPLGDLRYLDVERMAWTAVEPSGPTPEPREGHTAAIIGRYMLVAGGSGAPVSGNTAEGTGVASRARAAAAAAAAATAAAADAGAAAAPAGPPRRLADAFVLDLFTGPQWAVLDDGGWAAALPWLKPGACYWAVHGSRLLVLKPNLHEGLHELQVTELTTPDEIDRLCGGRLRGGAAQSEAAALELSPESEAGATWLSLSWHPPARNAERVASYKLMLATPAGAVREVFSGRATAARVAGLRPNSEYVFAVKATYDDGSHVWSDSAAYRTRLA